MKRLLIAFFAIITVTGYAMEENFTVVHKPSMMIVGIECRTSNNPNEGPQDIPKLWGRFYGEDVLSQIPNKASSEVVALYCDYESDHTKPYSVVIGCQTTSVDEIPEGMVAKVLPATSYAVYRAVGDFPKSLIDTWGHIWQTSKGRTYTGDFEVYGEKFVSGSPKELDVFIAIEH